MVHHIIGAFPPHPVEHDETISRPKQLVTEEQTAGRKEGRNAHKHHQEEKENTTVIPSSGKPEREVKKTNQAGEKPSLRLFLCVCALITVVMGLVCENDLFVLLLPLAAPSPLLLSLSPSWIHPFVTHLLNIVLYSPFLSLSPSASRPLVPFIDQRHHHHHRRRCCRCFRHNRRCRHRC